MMSADPLIAIISIVFPVVELVGILTAVHAIMNARTSQSAVAWAIALVAFPWLAVILYAVFGRNKFQGYVFLRSTRNAVIHHLIDAVRAEAAAREFFKTDLSDSEVTLTRLAEMPITRFNATRLLIDGQETFQSMFAAIAAARHYILIQFYIVNDDNLGREFKARLIEKARQNVRIYFIYDEIGSHRLPQAYIRELRDAGVAMRAFHTNKGKTNRFQLNFRNHRKIVVVDGQTAYLGGLNVGDEYMSRHKKFGPFRDTHVKVAGPCVQAIQYSFAEDWYWATAEIPDLNWNPRRAESGREPVLVIPSGPADVLDTCGLMFVHAIHSARKRIWIASPYFVPDIQVLSALKLAALRGADVRVLLPEKPDHLTVYLASFSYYPQTLPFGIQLYRYTAGFMHQKAFVVDSDYAAVGTANLDNRSFRLNFEITLINFDPAFVTSVADMLERDFSRSRPAELTDYTQTSPLFKFAVRSARLLAPIL
jgi:cardiolipin synthase